MKRFFAATLIGLHLIRQIIFRIVHLLTRRFRKNPISGTDIFNANYGADRIIPLTSEEAANFARMGRCICCGLCDSACDNIRSARLIALRSPSLVALTHSRDLPASIYAGPLLAEFERCGDCSQCIDVCPTDVPINDIVRMLTRLSKYST